MALYGPVALYVLVSPCVVEYSTCEVEQCRWK